MGNPRPKCCMSRHFGTTSRAYHNAPLPCRADACRCGSSCVVYICVCKTTKTSPPTILFSYLFGVCGLLLSTGTAGRFVFEVRVVILCLYMGPDNVALHYSLWCVNWVCEQECRQVQPHVLSSARLVMRCCLGVRRIFQLPAVALSIVRYRQASRQALHWMLQ